MPEGIIIPTDINIAPHRARFERLEDYQTAVDGLIEPVTLRDLNATLYVNEEGLLRRLPANQRATIFWWYWDHTVRSATILAGNAILIGTPDADGEITDLPAELFRLLLDTDRYRIQARGDDGPWHTSPDAYDDYYEAAALAGLITRSPAGQRIRIVADN